MTVLIAGATGFVGRRLVEALGAAHDVHGLARRPAGADWPKAQWHHADLSRPSRDWQLPSSWDALVYLAQSDGYRAFPERAGDMLAVNVDAFVRLLELSRQCGATRVVLASSANVYAKSGAPIGEDWPIAPDSFYARTKRSAELLAEPYGAHLAVTIARLFTIYGPGQRADTLIGSLIDRVGSGQPVQVQGPRGLLLSPVFIDDAVGALARLVARPAGGAGFEVFNVAGAEAVGVGELAARIGEVVNCEPIIERTGGPDPEGWIGDSSAIGRAVSWSAATALVTGLRATVAASVA